MTGVDVHSLVGAYALDALDDLERAAFERHVAGCAACRTELDELRETAARLADGAWSVPPPSLRVSVLAEVGRTRQVSAPARRRVPRDRLRRWSVAAAAAVVLAAGTGTAVFTVQEQRVRDQQALLAAAERRAAILGAPDVVVRSSPMRGGGTVTVASSASHHAAVVTVGATAAPAGSFQLWAIHGTTPTDAGVMPAGAAAEVMVVDGLPGSDALGVTLEPAGGSPTPTQPLVARISLA